ncbi:unnamed protein product [Diplocarpon coronariae]|nr:hypothetical protein JHW43_009286 [Diplocarpon mali]
MGFAGAKTINRRLDRFLDIDDPLPCSGTLYLERWPLISSRSAVAEVARVTIYKRGRMLPKKGLQGREVPLGKEPGTVLLDHCSLHSTQLPAQELLRVVAPNLAQGVGWSVMNPSITSIATVFWRAAN